MTDKYEVMAIKYFTARVTKDADDPDAAIKQQQYLEALKSLGLVEIIEGYYKRFRANFRPNAVCLMRFPSASGS